MEFIAGVLVTLIVLALFASLRLRQFGRKYRYAYKRFAYETPSTILLFEHFRGTPELVHRLAETKYLYDALRKDDVHAKVLLSTGRLYGERAPIAELSKEKLVEMGVPREDIHVYLGENNMGAADTYEETVLACKWLRAQGEHSAYVIANPLQAFHVYYLSIYNGIFPHLEPVKLLEARVLYIVGKLLQAALVFFDPRGWNPLSMWMRYRRRYIKSTI